ncbi:MAG: flagellar hook-basal body complex protein FliE [Labilithrix sp.]|nr:flagellar hook-basal body complex protein FliE [Labilithrix sp.]MCW5817663.1 flagellar hook-basal body complex protein FliE [Labilithrix sp.]
MKIESSGYASMMRQAAIERRQELQIGGEPGTPEAKKSEHVTGPSFGKVLEDTAMAASDKEREAMAKAEALAAGTSDDLHGTMITMKEADISMRLVGSVRDKLMDAFHELWRINV